MKKLYSVVAAAGLALAFSGCGSNSLSTASMENQDEKTLCDVSANGIESVLNMAEKHNAIAKEHGVEFKRLGMTNTQYINETRKAVKTGAKEVVLLNKKGKPTKNSVTVEYAAQRACKFAISALTQEIEGKTTWRAAVPGDGFQY
jgi:basic membrane lipoprotein Med (substrate-binding protein (PBP1-ABC) superfamily)